MMPAKFKTADEILFHKRTVAKLFGLTGTSYIDQLVSSNILTPQYRTSLGLCMFTKGYIIWAAENVPQLKNRASYFNANQHILE